MEEEYVVEHNNCNRDEASNPFLRRANATGREGGEAPESERACNLEDYVSTDPYLPFSIDADRTYLFRCVLNPLILGHVRIPAES